MFHAFQSAYNTEMIYKELRFSNLGANQMRSVLWSVNREVKKFGETLFYAFLWFSNLIFVSA